MKIRNLSFVLIISLLASCKNESKYELIAGELCECLRPIVEVYESTKSISEENNPEDIQTATQKMELAAEESNACVDRLTEKYGNMENQDTEVEAAMQRVCPNVVKTMKEFESGE